MQIGDPIIYSQPTKHFEIDIPSLNSPFVGCLLSYEDGFVDAMYKGFLKRMPIEIAPTTKPYYVQSYLYSEFIKIKSAITEKMPNIKRLKRLNLKMFERKHALILHDNLDKIIDRYADTNGIDKAYMLKSMIATQDIFINDNGIIKTYSLNSNELKVPDVETTGNFLCYFTFQYANRQNSDLGVK